MNSSLVWTSRLPARCEHSAPPRRCGARLQGVADRPARLHVYQFSARLRRGLVVFATASPSGRGNRNSKAKNTTPGTSTSSTGAGPSTARTQADQAQAQAKATTSSTARQAEAQVDSTADTAKDAAQDTKCAPAAGAWPSLRTWVACPPAHERPCCRRQSRRAAAETKANISGASEDVKEGVDQVADAVADTAEQAQEGLDDASGAHAVLLAAGCWPLLRTASTGAPERNMRPAAVAPPAGAASQPLGSAGAAARWRADSMLLAENLQQGIDQTSAQLQQAADQAPEVAADLVQQVCPCSAPALPLPCRLHLSGHACLAHHLLPPCSPAAGGLGHARRARSVRLTCTLLRASTRCRPASSRRARRSRRPTSLAQTRPTAGSA